MVRPSRHANLLNPDGEPERAPIDVSCTVHFNQYQGAFPRTKMIRWLESLPADAKIKVTSSHEPYFEATWTEER